MSLYYEAADLLTAPTNAGGSLKSRIFNKKDLKSQPAQVYALAIETCKWSSVLKEVVENAEILRLEHKVMFTPQLTCLLVLTWDSLVVTDSLDSSRPRPFTSKTRNCSPRDPRTEDKC